MSVESRIAEQMSRFWDITIDDATLLLRSPEWAEQCNQVCETDEEGITEIAMALGFCEDLPPSQLGPKVLDIPPGKWELWLDVQHPAVWRGFTETDIMVDDELDEDPYGDDSWEGN